MKRYIILSVLSFLLIVPCVKAQNIAALFSNMPDEHIPYLETAWRKDLIDLYNAGKTASLKNTMEGTSALLKLTDNYLFLQATERSTIEMRLLPLINNTHIICMVTTVYAPVGDSRVSFFTTDWQPLDANELLTPINGNWFLKEDADKSANAYKDIVARLDMELIQYKLSPDSLTLTASYSTPLYLNQEERKKLKPYLKETPRVFTWESSRFN